MNLLKYTFEISIAGCNTECAHCYISGGKSTIISLENYKEAISKLNIILKKLNGKIHVTIGNEIFIHPQISDILSLMTEQIPEYFSYDGLNGYVPTTGIALLNRKDRNTVLTSLKSAGCTGFMLTIHGNKEHHNLIAKNNLAFDSAISSIKWLQSEGFKIKINLMLNKFLCDDWQTINGILSDNPDAESRITIPLYIPVDRLRAFQQYRAEYNDCMKLQGKFDKNDFFENCEKNIFEKLCNGLCFDYVEEEQWAFFNITQTFDIFYGNVGMHTQLLGNLLGDDPDELFNKISSLPSNCDWQAFYDIKKLPPVSSIICNMEPLTTNFVYPSINDCIYSWFDKIGIPNIFI